MSSSFEKKIQSRINMIIGDSDLRVSDIRARMDKENEPSFDDLLSSRSDYSFGWKDAIEEMIAGGANDGLLLMGPDGCGKHTAADISVYSLSSEGYRTLYLSSKDFDFTDEEIKADADIRSKMIDSGDEEELTEDIVHTLLDKLLNRFFDDGTNICFVLEGIGQSRFTRQIYYRIGTYMVMYNSDDGFPDMYTVVIEQNEELVPSILRRYLRLIRMSYPSVERRRKALINFGVPSKDAAAVAVSTEGLTYSQLRDLGANIAVRSRAQDVSGEFYKELIASQLPAEICETQERNEPSDERKFLYGKIGELIDNIPMIVEKLGSRTVVAAPMVQSATVPSDNRQNDIKQDPVNKNEKYSSLSDFEREQAELAAKSKKSSEDISEDSKTRTLQYLFADVLGEERVNDLFENKAGSSEAQRTRN